MAVDPRFFDLVKHLWRGGKWAMYWTPDTDEGKLSWWFDASNPPKPVDSKFINLYFGIHTCSVNRGMRQRATIDTIDAVNCLFAEFDLAQGQQPEHLLESINQLDVPPSVIVFSGGGYHCVPLDTEILTRDGWKTWEQVQPGETVLGYDRETGKTTWTTMRGKIVKASDKLVKVNNGVFSAVCTPEHKWVCDVKEGHQASRTLRNQLVPAKNISRRRHKIILSAPLENNQECSCITPKEAALLGWFATEGSMTKGSKQQVRISQSESLYADDIRNVLVDVPHSERYSHLPSDMITWNININWFKSLMQRADLTNGKHDSDWCKFVSRLSNEARDAFLDAVFKGDGAWNYNGKIIIQNPGNISDGIKLAIFLSGYTPLVGHVKDRDTEQTRYGKPFATWNMSVEDVGEGAVWCPQTDLGTWVMRQGDTICITGNCYWLLEQTYHIDGDDARQRIAEIQYAWDDYTTGDNHVKDLARVLRIPGTYNRKPEYEPNYPLVEIVRFDLDLVYSLDELYTQVESIIESNKAKKVTAAQADVVDVAMDDHTIVEKMLQRDAKAAALWNGNIDDYNDDHSDADLALCNKLAFWFGRDKQRMDRVFRNSALFRPKWLRDDYRNKTLDKAVANCTATYTPNGNGDLGDPEALIGLKPVIAITTPVIVNGNGQAIPVNSVKPQSNGQQNSNSRPTQKTVFDPWQYIGILSGIGYSFRMNDLDDTIEVNGKPMSDAIEAHINTDMRALGHKEINVIKDAYVAYASKHTFNPITDYLTAQVWDGQDHIAKLACYFTDKHDLIVYPDGTQLTVFHAFLKRWLIGAASKVLGQEQNAMLVLGGPQGIGKSYLATWLCSSLPDFGHEGPIRPDAHQETYMLMTKKFIWEVGELGATTKRQDVEAIKQLIMQKRASYKPPYAHNLINKWVVASFVGTVNDDGTGYLRDTTGNRRFMCVDLVGINKRYSKEVDVNQVWAQAVALYKAGETGAPVECEVESRDAINAQHVMINPAEVYLDKYFDIDADNDRWVEETAKIIAVLRDRGYQGNERQIQMDIAVVLKEKGCKNEKRPSRWHGIKEKSPLHTIP